MNVSSLLMDRSNHWYTYSQYTKTKISYPLSLREVKSHIRMDMSFTDDDNYLENLIAVATTIAENYIEKDIANTLTELRIDEFYGDFIRINEGNFHSVSTVLDKDSAPIGTVKRTYAQDNSFVIEWTSFIQSDPIYIKYYTGFEEDDTPALYKQAILIIIADLYDNQRSNIDWSGYTDNQVWQKLLDPYRIIRF